MAVIVSFAVQRLLIPSLVLGYFLFWVEDMDCVVLGVAIVNFQWGPCQTGSSGCPFGIAYVLLEGHDETNLLLCICLAFFIYFEKIILIFKK